MSAETNLLEEQVHLDRSYGALEKMRVEADHLLHSVLDLGRGGTFQSRTERDIVVRTSLARLAQLDIGDQALCFGRIDHLPEDDAPGESFHIGRLAVADTDLEPLVVDWRAPVAEPFYRATGLDPQGLLRRRHLGVKDRKVVSVEDELFVGEARADDERDGVVLGGPGALMAALSAPRAGAMGDIVATIQREQDEIIRAPLPGLLIVQGGPGTGKTAVALHRAAYLLYTHRFPLERQRVLVVGPNPLFLHYIERVLPSLGESGVTLSTISGLVPEAKVRASDLPDVAALKGDLRMVKLLAQGVVTRERALREDLVVPFGAANLRLSAVQSARLVDQLRRRGGSHNARRRQLERAIVDFFDEQYLKFQERFVGHDAAATDEEDDDDLDVAADGEETSADAARQRRKALLRTPQVVEALERMWPRLAPHQFVHDLLSAPALLRVAAQGLFDESEQSKLVKSRAASLGAVEWTAGDVALIDEARVLLGPLRSKKRSTPQGDAADASWPAGLGSAGSANQRVDANHEDEVATFGHIVVDEVQDLSPMQLRMLSRRSISGSMTVVGDLAQATGAWAPASWEEVAAQLTPGRAPRNLELTIGYRTPAEVLAVADKVLAVALPGVRPPRPVRSSGVAPRYIATTESALVDDLARVAREQLDSHATGRVAVLVARGSEGRIRSGLASRGLDPVDPRDVDGPGLHAPLVVLPAHESHGLEFDSVVVVEPSAIASGNGVGPTTTGLRTLYVALTRPTKALVFIHAERLPVGIGEG